MADATLDASALLAVIQDEPGSRVVFEALARGACAMGTVNISEVTAKLAERHVPRAEIVAALDSMRLEIHSFDLSQALDAGLLRPTTRDAGLSLGDRACLALAIKLGTRVLTADRSWTDLGLPLEVVLVR